MTLRRYGKFSLTTSVATDPATLEDMRLGLEFLKYVSPGVMSEDEEAVSLIEEIPVFVDLGAGKNFELTLTGNADMGSPLDQMPGRFGTIRIIQDGVGSHNLNWHTDWKPSGGIDPSLRSGAGESTLFRYRVLSVGNVALEKEPDAATLVETFAGIARDKYMSPYSIFESMVDVVLTDGATIVPNLNAGLTFSLTITADRHISNPTGQRSGKMGRIYIQQDAVGGHQVTWDTDWKFLSGVLPSVPIVSGGWTVVPYEVRSPGNIIAASVDPYAGGGSGGGETALPATLAEVKSAASISKYVNPSALSSLYEPYSLPNASTVLPDMDLGLNFILTLQQNCLVQNMVNQREGNGGFFIIIQGGAGGFVASWDTGYSFIGGTPVVPPAVSGWTIVEYRVQAFGIIRCTTIPTGGIPIAATVQDIWAGTDTGKYISSSISRLANVMVPLTDGPIISIDLNSGRNFKVTLEGSRAMDNPTNQASGKDGILKFEQDAIGGRTVSWGSDYIFDGDPPVLESAPLAITILPYHVEEPNKVIIG